MSTHRATEWADAMLEDGAVIQRIALQLAQPELPPNQRVALAFELNRTALDLNALSEDVRRGRRKPGKESASLFVQRSA